MQYKMQHKIYFHNLLHKYILSIFLNIELFLNIIADILKCSGIIYLYIIDN